MPTMNRPLATPSVIWPRARAIWPRAVAVAAPRAIAVNPPRAQPVAIPARDVFQADAPSKRAITKAQAALRAQAFFVPAASTGSLDAATARAIGNFQNAVGLPRTGQLDRATAARLADRTPAPAPDPVVRDARGQVCMTKGADGVMKPMIARVVVAIGQHRVFRFDDAGVLQQTYPCRTGRKQDRGSETKPGVKVIDAKMSGQSLRDLGEAKWGEPACFGEALLALSTINPATGEKIPSGYNGQELHGVPNNAAGEPTGVGANYSHGCVGIPNAAIRDIAAYAHKGEVVRFDP